MCARASRISPRTRICRVIFFNLEPDLFRKPVSTFRDHALDSISPDAHIERAGAAMGGSRFLETDHERTKFRQRKPQRHRAAQHAALSPLRRGGALAGNDKN